MADQLDLELQLVDREEESLDKRVIIVLVCLFLFLLVITSLGVTHVVISALNARKLERICESLIDKC